MQAPPLRLFIQERTKLQGSLARYAQHAVRLRGFTASCSELTQDTYRRSNSFRIDKAILASGSLALLLYRAAGRAITPFGSTASGPAGAGGTITVGPGIAAGFVGNGVVGLTCGSFVGLRCGSFVGLTRGSFVGLTCGTD